MASEDSPALAAFISPRMQAFHGRRKTWPPGLFHCKLMASSATIAPSGDVVVDQVPIASNSDDHYAADGDLPAHSVAQAGQGR